MVTPTKSRVVQHDGVTAPPDQQRHTGPFAAQTNVTRSPGHVVVSEVSPSLGQPYSPPEHWQWITASPHNGRPEPYRPLSRINSQSGDRSIDEYNSEAGPFEPPSSANGFSDSSLLESYRPLSSRRGVTSMDSYPLLGDSRRPPSWTNSGSGGRNIDGYRGQTTLPESPLLAPSVVPRSPQPIVASAAYPLSPQQRGPSPRSRFVNDTDRFLPGHNSQGNFDIPGAPLRPNFQARSLLEAVGPPESHGATEHHWPLTGRRPNASSSSGGSANQYSRRVTPGLPPPASSLSGVLESRKHNVPSSESPSLHQEPTHLHSLISPPFPGATTSSQSPTWPASISTTRVTLPDEPQEVPDRVVDCALRLEPYRPLSRTYSRLGDGDLESDEYNGEATLSESPLSTMPRRHPKPSDALAESPFPFQQREISEQPHVVDNTGRFLPGRNSQGNSDILGTPLRPNLQLRSLSELVFPPVNHSATGHHQPLTGRGPNTPSSGGSAHQYNRRAAPPELPLPALSGVLESPKHNIASPGSLSLDQRPTYAPYLSSPSNLLPASTSSSQSPARLASIRTTWVTLPDGPREVPGKVDYELPYSGDESRGMLALPDEQRHTGPAATPNSATESPNPIVAFAESEPQGGSTNGIMWEVLR